VVVASKTMLPRLTDIGMAAFRPSETKASEGAVGGSGALLVRTEPFLLDMTSRDAVIAIFNEDEGALRTDGSLACMRADHLSYEHPCASGERGLRILMDDQV
jgi:hypothetical protein